MRAIDILTVEKLPVYVIGGDDDYLVRLAKRAVLSLADGVAKDFNISEFTVPKSMFQDTLSRIEDALETLPVMADARVVIADVGVGKLSKELETALAQLIKKHSETPDFDSVLVILSRESVSPALQKNAEVIDCNRLSVGELSPYVDGLIRASGHTISPPALRALIERSDRYLSEIIGELEKLYIFADNGVITIEHVDIVLKEKSEYIVFEITDALSRGDRRSAVRAIDRIVDAYGNESDGAMKILNVLIGHYRKMFYGRISPLTDAELGKEFNCKPYAITKARKAAASYKPMELKKILDRLTAIEAGVKQGGITVKEIIPLATCAVL